jgi:hypothetical protein
MIAIARWLPWAALALVAGTNAFLLASMARNRAGDPEATLALTERELATPYGWSAAREDSGLALAIVYRVNPTPSPGTPGSIPGTPDAWAAPEFLDRATLVALGVDVEKLERDGPPRGGAPTDREALVVLELDGPARAIALERSRAHAAAERALVDANPGKDEFVNRAKAAAQNAEREERTASRLFVVAAGTDDASLRSRYPDRTRHAIVRAIVSPSRLADKRVGATITRLAAGEIVVPLELRPAIEAPGAREAAAGSGERRARFDATVCWGTRREPWIVSASPRE